VSWNPLVSHPCLNFHIIFSPHLLSSHHKSTQPCLHYFRWHGRMGRVGWRQGKLGGPLQRSSLWKLYYAWPNSIVFCSVIFFRPLGHYVRNITLINQDSSSIYHIVAMRVIKHPGHTYRGFGSVLFRTGVWQAILHSGLQDLLLHSISSCFPYHFICKQSCLCLYKFRTS
jgi:hypothetical protein